MSKPTTQEASDLIASGAAVELVTLLGRWKSNAFAEIMRTSQGHLGGKEDGDALDKAKEPAAGTEAPENQESEGSLSEDDETPAAVKSGGFLDVFKKKVVVEKHPVRDLLCEYSM